MKCPNCSFMNPDRSVMCKICGYEFDTSSLHKESPNANSSVSNNDDSEIEVTFDTLFGVRSNPRKIKNPLDKSKDKKRVLRDDSHDSELEETADVQRQAQVSDLAMNETHTSSVESIESVESTESVEFRSVESVEPHDIEPEYIEPEYIEPEYKPELNKTKEVSLDENGDVIDIELIKTGDIQNDFYSSDDIIGDSDDLKESNQKVTLILLTVVILLVILVLVFMSSKLKFDPFASEPESQVAPASEPVDNVPADSNNPQNEVVINISPDDTVNAFFKELPNYVNNDSLSISQYFEEPQSVLELLTAIKNKGDIDKIDFNITDTAVSDTTTVSASSTIERTNENKHLISQDQWQFELVLANEQWLIRNFSLNNDKSTTSTNTENATSSNAASTSTSTSSSTVKPIKPEGFVKSGSFKGGIITDGQDISTIRYGNHDQFERLVIDLTEWQKTNADGSAINVNEACHYETSISEDGLEVTITLSGARAASAVIPNLTGSANIQSVTVFHPSDDSVIGLTLKLKRPSSYKVFPLKEPGRIVIDTMPN